MYIKKNHFKIFLLAILFILSILSVNSTLNTSIDSYYKFDNNSFADATGNYLAANNSGTTNITGIIKDGRNFDGVNNYISLGDHTSAETQKTINIWYNPDNTGTAEFTLGAYGSGGSNRWYFQRSAADQMVFATVGGTTHTSAAFSFDNSVWTMITLFLDSTNNKIIIYENATVKLNATYNDDFLNGNTWTLGWLETGGNYDDSQMDEIGIWNRYLTLDELSNLYNNGDGFQYPFNITPPPAPANFTLEIINVTINGNLLTNGSYFNNNQLDFRVEINNTNVTNYNVSYKLNSGSKTLIQEMPFVSNFTVAYANAEPETILLDENYIYISGESPDQGTIHRYTKQRVYVDEIDLTAQVTRIYGMEKVGTDFYIYDSNTQTIYVYNSTWGYTGTSYDISARGAVNNAIVYNNDNNYWYIPQGSVFPENVVVVYDNTFNYITNYTLSELTTNINTMEYYQNEFYVQDVINKLVYVYDNTFTYQRNYTPYYIFAVLGMDEYGGSFYWCDRVNDLILIGDSSFQKINSDTLLFGLNVSDGNYNLTLYLDSNVTNSTKYYSFTVDTNNPTLNVSLPSEYNYYNGFNFSQYINYSDNIGVANCTVSISGESSTSCDQQNYNFTTNGNKTINITVTDLSGLTNSSLNNILLINPINFIYIQLANGTEITNYTIDGTTVLNNPYNFTHYSLGLGSQTLEFQKFGYITQNITFTLNTTNQLNLTINVSETNIIVNLYDRTTGLLLNGTNVTVNILGVSNTTTNTGQAIFKNGFSIGNYSVQGIAINYYTEQKDFYYSGFANSTVSLYLLDQTLNNSATLYVPVTDEFDNIIADADVRLLEYDVSIFGFKEVSQCYTDSNGECRFLIEVGTKTYIVTGQKVINGILYTDQSSENGEILQPEISGGEEILGRDIIRALKLKITDTVITPNFYGLLISSPSNENETITSQNLTSTKVYVPVHFTATDGLDYTVCVKFYRFTNGTINKVTSDICTTGSSGILPVSTITFNRDYNYQIWVTASTGGSDEYVYKKYYYYSDTSFFEKLKSKHYVNPLIIYLWALLMALTIYLRTINLWVYGSWTLSIFQLILFPGVLFGSASALIILINAGVLYLSKRTGDLQ